MSLRIEYMALPELVTRFHPDNPKEHDVGGIAGAISTLNYQEPVMLDERSGLLAAGHGRIKALASMQQQQMERPNGIQSDSNGAWLVPVVCGSEFTPEQLSAYLVASNNLTMAGGWHDQQLAELLQGLAAEDKALLESTGYDGERLDELLRDLGMNEDPTPAPEPQIDRAAELQEKWKVRRGDVWEIESKTGNGSHFIMCGDSTCEEDVARLMDGVKADAVVTDPPYGQLYLQGSDNRPKSQSYNRTQKRHVNIPIIGDDAPFDPSRFLDFDGVVILWGGNMYSDKLPCKRGWLVWDKHPGMASCDFADGELAWTNRDAVLRIFRHSWAGVIRASQNGEIVNHPTEKPIALFVWCFDACKVGNIVFDPYMGSGPIVIACEQTSRLCRGMEIHEPYVAVCLQRLSDMGLTPRLTNGR